MLKIEQFICQSNNFGVIIHDAVRGRTMVVDVPDAAPILKGME